MHGQVLWPLAGWQAERDGKGLSHLCCHMAGLSCRAWLCCVLCLCALGSKVFGGWLAMGCGWLARVQVWSVDDALRAFIAQVSPCLGFPCVLLPHLVVAARTVVFLLLPAGTCLAWVCVAGFPCSHAWWPVAIRSAM